MAVDVQYFHFVIDMLQFFVYARYLCSRAYSVRPYARATIGYIVYNTFADLTFFKVKCITREKS